MAGSYKYSPEFSKAKFITLSSSSSPSSPSSPSSHFDYHLLEDAELCIFEEHRKHHLDQINLVANQIKLLTREIKLRSNDDKHNVSIDLFRHPWPSKKSIEALRPKSVNIGERLPKTVTKHEIIRHRINGRIREKKKEEDHLSFLALTSQNRLWSPVRTGDEAINHSLHAVEAAQYAADFFVNQARTSTHAFASADEAAKSLIYNYPVSATTGDFVQTYFFSKTF